MYKFVAYQKTIEVPFDLSDYGFQPSKKEPDIKVKIKKKEISSEYKNKIYAIDDDLSYIYKKNVGLFLVKQGKEITIVPETSSKTLIAQHLINFPFALCLSQNSSLVLHASAIYFKGKVLLFCGKSHAGKSTTSALFYKNGGRLIAEDISVTKFIEEPKILPSAPYIKLSDEASERLKITNKIKTIKEHDKRTFYKGLNFFKESLSIDYCFFLDWSNETAITDMHESDVIKNLITYSFVSGSNNDLKKILKLLPSVKFYKFKIKKDFDEIEKIFSATVEKIGLQL